MEIILARFTGFCWGVKRAIRRAEAAARSGRRVASLGPLVHNPQQVQKLEELGLRVVEKPEDAGDILVIRTHGVGPGLFSEAEYCGVEIVNGTCPFVRRVQEKALDLQEDGYQVVVVGDPDHPEVRGVVGWTGGRALVVESDEDVANLPCFDKIGVVAQTTLRRERFFELVELLREKAREVQVEDTICSATSDRQVSARQLAREVDVMIVVGGRTSSNTAKLADLCRDQGVPTYQIETAGELKAEWFRHAERAGVTAGASTPDWVIKEVVDRMEDFKEEQVNDEAEGSPAMTGKELERDVEEVGAGEAQETAGEVPPVAEQAAEAEDREEQVAETQEGFVSLEQGDIVQGTVVQVNPDNVLVDVGYKSEGLIPLSELNLKEGQDPSDVLSVGETIDVYVLSVDGRERGVLLSQRRAAREAAWRKLQEGYANKTPVTGKVVEEVKGGLIVDVGLRGFMPASHVERGYVSDLSVYVGREVRAKVVELDRAKNRVILSQKAVLEDEYQQLRAKTLSELREGQIREGVVKGITDFGAFVDLGGVDGLLHVSEMSWGRVEHPSDVVSLGQELKVKVLNVNRQEEKVSLGLKQILPDPWEDVADNYPEGSIVKGKVMRLVPFGAFVQLEPGVEGLVHISQLADHHVQRPEEVVSEGEEIKVKVLRVQPHERRISLSLKEALAELGKNRLSPQEKGENLTIGEVYGELLEETRDRLNNSLRLAEEEADKAADEATDEGERQED